MSQTRYSLGRFRAPDSTIFSGAVVGSRVIPLRLLHPQAIDLNQLLDDWPESSKILDESIRTVDREEAGRPLDDLLPLAPYDPRQVFQAGANYKTHIMELVTASATEAGETDLEAVRARTAALVEERVTNGVPYVFIGLASSVCGPSDDIVLSTTGRQHDWELELAVVIGRTADKVGRDRALDHIAGYTIVNDLTVRDRIFRPDLPGIGTDWLAGKNGPTFLPLGPWLTPTQFVPDPSELRITLQLNGETMQNESVQDMIFDAARLIEYISAITPMRPGDLLLTGSPAGNGAHYGRYLRPGDVLESSITGLGTQRNTCVQG